MNNFIYNTPTKVFFGKNQEDKLGEILKSYNIKKVLLHYGKESIKKSGLYDKVINQLKAFKIDFVELGGVTPNPKLSLALKGVEIAKKEKVDLILAVGGGSVIDSAKLISVGAKVDFNPWLFSIKEKTPNDHIPVGTILTISAAGSDMSNSCVITNDTTKEKRGFVSEENRCLFAILNPELTYTVSKYQTACGIVDIMMHTLERYFSSGDDTPLTDNIALGLLKAVYDAGKILITDPYNYNARATIMWANSLSHNGLTGVGRNYIMSVHQLEHELSGMYDEISHGAGLAVLWPAWAKIAYKAEIKRFSRYAYEVIGITKTNDSIADILKAIEETQNYFISLGMPKSLRELNVKESSLEELAHNTMFKGKRVLEDIIKVDYEMAYKILKLAY
ncbi:MAG: iron-containing alcohol dehydrogenase [Anaeroplasma sp.]|nr:iron-containing alcohol dehydrogenase [Anaeroplasma sp.]